MATVLAKDRTTVRVDSESDDNSGVQSGSKTSLVSIPSLGAAIEEKRFWYQRRKGYDPDAIATQVCLPS